VLRSYSYIFPHALSLGTSVGVLNALILNGNVEVSLESIPESCASYRLENFQCNGLANDLVRKWNSCNMCLISEIMTHTIKLNVEVSLYFVLVLTHMYKTVHLIISCFCLCRLSQ
jgi:hypothetical protein